MNTKIKDININNKVEKLPKRLPWVIPANCEGCGSCVNHCKRGCLKMMETNIEGIFVPWLEEPHKCSGCGQCTSSCIMGAISMTNYVDMAAMRFKEQLPVIPTEDAS